MCHAVIGSLPFTPLPTAVLTFDPELEGGLEDEEEDVGRGWEKEAEEEEEFEGGTGPAGLPSLKASPRVGHALLGREGLQNPNHTCRHYIHLNGSGSGESHDLLDRPHHQGGSTPLV